MVAKKKTLFAHLSKDASSKNLGPLRRSVDITKQKKKSTSRPIDEKLKFRSVKNRKATTNISSRPSRIKNQKKTSKGQIIKVKNNGDLSTKMSVSMNKKQGFDNTLDVTETVSSTRGKPSYVDNNKIETRRSVIIHASEIIDYEREREPLSSEMKDDVFQTNGLMLLASHAEHVLRAESDKQKKAEEQETNDDIEEKYNHYKKLAEMIIKNKETQIEVNGSAVNNMSKWSSQEIESNNELLSAKEDDKVKIADTRRLKHPEKSDLKAWFPSISNVNLTPSSQVSELITQRLLFSSQRLLGSDTAQVEELVDGLNKKVINSSKNTEIFEGICPNRTNRKNKEDPHEEMENGDSSEGTLPSLLQFQNVNAKSTNSNATVVSYFNDVVKTEPIETIGDQTQDIKQTQEMFLQNNINIANTEDPFLSNIVVNEMNFSNPMLFPFIFTPQFSNSSVFGTNAMSATGLAFLFQPLSPPALSVPNHANPFNSFPKSVSNTNNIIIKTEPNGEENDSREEINGPSHFATNVENEIQSKLGYETANESQISQDSCQVELDYITPRSWSEISPGKSGSRLKRRQRNTATGKKKTSDLKRAEMDKIENINLQLVTNGEIPESEKNMTVFICEFCFKQFTNKDTMRRHILTHNGRKRHKCLYCARSFYTETSYISHVKTHTGEKAHKCDNCSMSFGKKSALEVHLRTHTGERPYQCTYCGKSFSISGNLHRHLLIHTGLRPYKCGKCNKTFNNPSHLARHISSIHGGHGSVQAPGHEQIDSSE